MNNNNKNNRHTHSKHRPAQHPLQTQNQISQENARQKTIKPLQIKTGEGRRTRLTPLRVALRLSAGGGNAQALTASANSVVVVMYQRLYPNEPGCLQPYIQECRHVPQTVSMCLRLYPLSKLQTLTTPYLKRNFIK